jgi:hypothetical protein
MQQRLILDYIQGIYMMPRPPEITPSAQYERTPYRYVEPRSISQQVEPRYSSNTRRREPYISSYRVPREPLYYERRPSHYFGSLTPQEAAFPRPTPGSQIDPTDPSGIRGVLIQDSYALIDRKNARISRDERSCF